MKLFDLDSPIMQFLSRVYDLMYLNILFAICCIPFFTVGASLTAMYSVTLKMVKNEETYVGKEFFRAFRRNFKQATGIWLIVLAVALVLYGDYQIIAKLDIPGRSAIQLALMCITLICFSMFLYVFPILARFVNTVKGTIKNSLLMCIAHLPYTFLFLGIQIIILIIFSHSAYAMYTTMFISIIGGTSVVLYVNSIFFRKIFKRYEPEEETADTDDDSDNANELLTESEK